MRDLTIRNDQYATYKGYQCCNSGYSWSSMLEFGSAPTLEMLCLKIDQYLIVNHIKRVRLKEEGVYGVLECEHPEEYDKVLVSLDMGPVVSVWNDELDRLTPVEYIQDDYDRLCVEAKVISNGKDSRIIGCDSYIEGSFQKDLGIGPRTPEWEDLELYFKDGEYSDKV